MDLKGERESKNFVDHTNYINKTHQPITPDIDLFWRMMRQGMIREGKAKKGDGKDVDHVSGLRAGNGDSNLRVLSASVNRHYNRRSKRTKAPKKL